MLAQNPAARPAPLTGGAVAVIVILTVQLLLGAWTAGLNAGYAASTWPSMNDHSVPEGIAWSGGALMATTNSSFLIPFLHPCCAGVVAVSFYSLARPLWRGA